MGTEKQHHLKAEQNQKFIDFVRSSVFPEWAAIAIFYKAVHLVEEMLAHKGWHTNTHRQRQAFLKAKFPEILRPFRTLFNFAIQSRYQFRPVKKSQIETLESLLSSLESMTSLEIREGGYSG